MSISPIFPGGFTHDGFLESEDDLEEVRLPSSVVGRAFKRRLWDRINLECGTYIDEYEGVWIEFSAKEGINSDSTKSQSRRWSSCGIPCFST